MGRRLLSCPSLHIEATVSIHEPTLARGACTGATVQVAVSRIKGVHSVCRITQRTCPYASLTNQREQSCSAAPLARRRSSRERADGASSHIERVATNAPPGRGTGDLWGSVLAHNPQSAGIRTSSGGQAPHGPPTHQLKVQAIGRIKRTRQPGDHTGLDCLGATGPSERSSRLAAK